MIYPASIKPGDRIAVISPSTEVKPEYIDGACRYLESLGFEPVIFPHAKGPADGSYASSRENRLDDLLAALTDRSIKAILCARGGYGAIHLLPLVPQTVLRNNPKWLVGFSDISALHALLNKAGIASIHGPMAKHLTLEPPKELSTVSLIEALTTDKDLRYEVPTHPQSVRGEASGRIFGGNLAVLNSLASTPFDLLSMPLEEDAILFLEDINEAIYATERMLSRLYMSGVLSKVKGLIFGSFSDYRADRNYDTMEDMISARLKDWGINIPVAMSFPIGHERENLPVIEGSIATLRIEDDVTELVQRRE